MRARIESILLLGLLPLLIPVMTAGAQTESGDEPRSTPEAVTSLLENRLDSEVIVPGELIVKFKEDAEPMATLAPMDVDEDVARTSGGELVVRLSSAAFTAMAAEERLERTLDMVEQLRQRDDVEYVQPNYLLQIVREPRDPLYDEQWHYFENRGGIGLPAVWDVTTGSADVVVAVLDTGILGDHADIDGSPNLLDGFDMISNPTVAADGDGRDADPTDPGDGVRRGECGVDMFGNPRPPRDLPDSWHGSHVAGTVGVGRSDNDRGVAGVNWQVGLLPVRVLGKCGGSTVDINDAVRWAAGLPVPGVPANPNPARVINLSLGGFGSCAAAPATQRAIDDAVAAGALVVVAAGNEASDAANFIPAGCERVLTVAAADRRGHLAARYSNFGDRVDILAPGGDVLRDDDGDGQGDGVLSYVRGGYDLYNGTSMAAPHVAGVAALLAAERPELTPAEIEQELVDSARPRNAAQCPRPCGAGLLDASVVLDGVEDDNGGDENGEDDEEKPDNNVPAASPLLLLLALLLVLLLAGRRRNGDARR